MRSVDKQRNSDYSNLSSTDYINYVLKRGPYSNKIRVISRTKEPLRTRFEVENTFNDAILPYFTYEKSGFHHHEQTFANCKTKVDNLITDVKHFEDILDELKKDQIKTNIWSSMRGLLSRVSGYGVSLEDSRIPATYLSKYKQSLERFNANKEEYISAINDYIDYKPVDYADTLRIKNKFQQDKYIQQIAFDYNMIKRLEILKEFDDVATESQRQKFRQLIACEQEIIGM